MPEPTNTDLLIILTRVEAKVDTAVTNVADHEKRIRKSDAWRYAMPASMFLTIIASVYGSRIGG